MLILFYENFQSLISYEYQSHQLTLKMFESEILTYFLSHDSKLNTRQNHAQWQTKLTNIQVNLMTFQFSRDDSLRFVDNSQKYEIQKNEFIDQKSFENEQVFWTIRAKYRQTRTRKELKRTFFLNFTKFLTFTCHNIIKQHFRQISFKHFVYLFKNYDLEYHNVIAKKINEKWRIVIFFDFDVVVIVFLFVCFEASMFSRIDSRSNVMFFKFANMSIKRSQFFHNYVRYLNTFHDYFSRCSKFYNEISKFRTSKMLLIYFELKINVFVNEKKWLKWIRTTIEDVQDFDWEFFDDFFSNIDCNITSSNEINNSWEKKFNNNCTSSNIEINDNIISQKFDDIYESIFSKFNIVVAQLTTLTISKKHFINREISDMFSILNQTWCEIFYSRSHIFIEIEIWNEKSVLCVNQNMIAKILCFQFSCDTIAFTICFELMIYVDQHRVQHHFKTFAKFIDITFFSLILRNDFYNDVVKTLMKLFTLQFVALLNITSCVIDEKRDDFTHRRNNIEKIRQYLLFR